MKELDDLAYLLRAMQHTQQRRARLTARLAEVQQAIADCDAAAAELTVKYGESEALVTAAIDERRAKSQAAAGGSEVIAKP